MKLFYPAVILLLILSAFPGRAQYSRYIIPFTDKNASPYSLGNPGAFLSSQALARRARYQLALDSTDLPLNPAYVDSIQAIPHVQILNRSKWLNQLCIKTADPAALARIASFPFVKSANPLAPVAQPQVPHISLKFDGYTLTPVQHLPVTHTRMGTEGPQGITGVQDYFNYGSNYPQVHIHQGEYLHNLGFRGEGMTIAILDAGFYNYLNNPVFDSLLQNNQVLGHWDYVNNEPSVVEDHPHGAWCLSTLAANAPGSMVGTAPKAHYWLLRTEDAATEYPVEEQNWAAAAEFADSAGVDMISSSLGYSYFDDPSFDHHYAQRDGRTSIISRAATLAVKKGILVTNSAGNSGGNADESKYVICPADADSVLSIGAVDVNGQIAWFSSLGPNGAGQLKPNVVSVGLNAVVANASTGQPVNSNGTSFSNPNLCGLVACLWQAFPEFSNMEIIDAVQRSASRYSNPDDSYGYGIPNMKAAYSYLSTQRILRNNNQILGAQWIKAFPVPFQNRFSVLLKAQVTGKADLRLFDMQGRLLESQTLQIQQDNFYTLAFSSLGAASKGMYSLYFNDGKNKTSLRIIKQ